MLLGAVSQWGEVKKKHPKLKEAPSSTDSTAGPRGGRGRGSFEGRGRGRGIDRGRGARVGRVAGSTNGTPRVTDRAAKVASDGGEEAEPTTTTATGGWDSTEKNGSSWDRPTNGESHTTADTTAESVKESTILDPKSNVIPAGKVTGWANLFAKPATVPTTKKAPTPVAVPSAEETQPEREAGKVPVDGVPPPASLESQNSVEDGVVEAVEVPPSDPVFSLTPSKDELTETNLEQLPDTSHPPATATAASTTASTQDPTMLGSVASAIRPGMSGYAASALKATGATVRSASFQRRIMEQQAPVVMPGNHAVDRAAVQFGSMGLNTSSEDLDVDEDREEPETRTQLPDDSPVAPRASLPPPPPHAQPQSKLQPQAPTELEPTPPRQAPGLPPAPQQQQPASPPHTTAYADQFARYGQGGQKAYDPFGQQAAQPQPQQPQAQSQDAFNGQAPTQAQQPTSSTPSDFSAFYGSNQHRDPYQSYYAGYTQGHEAQQRSGSSFGTTSQDTQGQYVTNRPQIGYGQLEAQNSGHNTPNPSVPSQQTQQPQHMPQAQNAHAGYPYGYQAAYNQQYPQYGSYMNQMGTHQHRYGQNRPMFDDVRRQTDDYYMSQNNHYGYGQQYGAGPYNKSSMYSQPQHQYSYDHSASPANAGSFNQNSMVGRDGTYGRAGSAQPAEAQQTGGSNAFGGVNDPFGRTHSGFGGQAQPMSQQHSGQHGNDDPGKSYDGGKAAGPSPSISQAHRPGSAVNTSGQQPGGQSGGFPPPLSQTNQQPFGGYPQYGGLSGVGAHHQGQGSHPQNSGYGAYGGSAAFGGYAGYGSGRGWNGSYGGH